MPTPQKNIKTQESSQGIKPVSLIIWSIIIALQIAAGYGLFYLLRILLIPAEITNSGAFVKIMAVLIHSCAIAAWLIGIIGLWVIRKSKPTKVGFRLLTALGLALIPVLILAYLGNTVGFDDLSIFNEIVVGKMIPYYTNLTMVMSILGFYLPEWFSKVVKPKKK